MPAIEPGHKANFKTLQKACKAGHLALLDCHDTVTGKPARIVCAVNCDENENCTFVPLAVMVDGDAYTRYVPPTDGGQEV